MYGELFISLYDLHQLPQRALAVLYVFVMEAPEQVSNRRLSYLVFSMRLPPDIMRSVFRSFVIFILHLLLLKVLLFKTSRKMSKASFRSSAAASMLTEHEDENSFQPIMDQQAFDEKIFAFLVPIGKLPTEAFSDALQMAISDLSREHERQFFLQIGASTPGSPRAPASSPCSNQLRGVYMLSLETPPAEKEKGYILGTSEGRHASVDLLLAPPSHRWASQGLRGQHASIAFSPDSCRVMIKAKHDIFYSQNGMRILRAGQQHVLENDMVIVIGGNTYMFQYTKYFLSDDFKNSLIHFMEGVHGSAFELHGLLTPAAMTRTTSLAEGKYVFSTATFAAGAFGAVAAGWCSSTGKAVAVKRFNHTNEAKQRYHKALMREIGHHVSSTLLCYRECC